MKKTIQLISCLLALSTNDLFSQWTQLSGPGNPVYSMAVLGTKLYAGTWNSSAYGGGGVFMSADSGNTWTSASNGLPNYAIDVLAVNGNNLYAGNVVGGNGAASVYMSTDSAANWTSISTGLNMTTVIEALACKDSFLFAGGSGISRTTNNGVSWTKCLTGEWIHALLFVGNDLFAGTGNGTILKSSDYGATWVSYSTGLPSQPVQALGVRGGKIFAGTGTGLYTSSNSGNNWSFCSTLNESVISIFATDSFLFATYFYSNVRRSLNNGANWFTENWGMQSNNSTHCYAAIGNVIFAGTNTVYRSKGNLLTEIKEFPLSTENILTLYPNPTSDQFYIQTNTIEKLKVDLYDVNGRHVFSATASDKEYINVASLDNGAYTLTIKAADRLINKKLVILR